MGNLTRNFSRSEFACKCGCGFDEIKPELVKQLQRFRDLLWIRTGIEVPVTVTCGCRCDLHNEAIGGAKNSYHTIGAAVDITFGSDITFWQKSHIPLIGARMAFLSNHLGVMTVNGIGAYPDRNFLHLDIRGARIVPITWINENGVYRYNVNFTDKSAF